MDDLGEIREEDCEESGDWGENKGKVLPTATSLEGGKGRVTDGELELMRVLCRNLQGDYDELKRLYEEEKGKLVAREEECEYLRKEMESMRYQFMGEVGRVTAIVKQYILKKQSSQLNV